MKSNIIFDLNYCMHKNAYTLNRLGTLYGDFYNAMTNNILKYTSMYRFDNVFIVSDSRQKSWRKQELDTYKAHRSKDESVDWEFVFKVYDEWKDDMKEKYNVVCNDHVEGDDWVTSIILKTNKKGYSNVVISSDRDMTQLLNYKINSDKKFINIQIDDINGKEQLFLPEGWELYLNDLEENGNTDVFNLDNSYNWNSFIKKLIGQWKHTDINPKGVLFQKIISGDKSDNIKSIGDVGAAKIWEFYKQNYAIHFDTANPIFPDEIINCIESVKDIELSDGVKEQTIHNIYQNIKLIELHYRHFPDFIVEKIINKLETIEII